MFDAFEGMHYVCFHYEFEHVLGSPDADVDSDCGVPGCPSGVLPVAAPGAEAEQALKDAAEGLRRPDDDSGWTAEFEGPGVLRLQRPGSPSVRLVAVEVTER